MELRIVTILLCTIVFSFNVEDSEAIKALFDKMREEMRRDSNELRRSLNQHDSTHQVRFSMVKEEMPDYSSYENPNSTEDEETLQNFSEIELLRFRLFDKDATIQVTKFSLKLGKISIETFSHLFRI